MQEGGGGESTEGEDGGIKNMEYVKVKKLKKYKVEVSDTDTEDDSPDSLSSSEEKVVVVKRKRFKKKMKKHKKKMLSEESDTDSDSDCSYEKHKYKKRKCMEKKTHPEGGLGGPVGQASGAPAGGAPLQVSSFADLEKLAASAMHPVENNL